MNKLKLNGASLANKLKQSRNEYAELYKPKQLKEVLGRSFYDHDYFTRITEILIREFETITFSKFATQVNETICVLGPKLNQNTWSFDGSQIELSRDLWEKKDQEEFWYQINGAVASVITWLIWNETHRGFHWKLIFYTLGHNPQRDLEEKKEARAITRETLSNAEFPKLTNPIIPKMKFKGNSE